MADGGIAGGADFLQLNPAVAPARGLTAWLADALRAAIMDGRLRPGTSLPATRVLAEDLGISRGVITEAYQRLTEEGLVTARRRTGTTVLPRPGPGRTGRTRLTGRAGPAEAAGWPGRAAPAAPPRPAPPAAPTLLPLPWRAGAEIDLSPGVPDLSGFPRAAWLRAERAVLGEASAADLGYGDPRGSERLRKELGGWLARTRGLRADPDDIIIVAGVAQALALLAQVLRARAETCVAVEDPGSFGTRNELAHWGLNPVPIPVDDQGMVVASLVRSGLRTALLTPAHQFPSGVVLAPRRRHDLLDWVAGGGLIIEDDYDAEYRYDRAPVPALQASAPDQIAYTGSTSKTLAPGMRLGWLIPPRRLHADLVTAKHASDLGSPSLPQLILARLIATGELERHTRLARKRQRTRRDALLTALREHLPSVRVQGVAAGLHLVIMFPGMAGEVDDAALASRLRTAGVLVHPLSMHRQRPGPPGLVLGYAAHPPGQLRDAALRIARAVHASAPSLPPSGRWGCPALQSSEPGRMRLQRKLSTRLVPQVPAATP
jgi:GntR family transcriptional regulator / MocR family aminotransferase